MSLRSEVFPYLEGEVSELADKCFADTAPTGTTRPYAVMLWDLNVSPQLQGDSEVSWHRWMGQLDLWQDSEVDDGSLSQDVLRALDGLKIIEGGMRLRVQAVTRVPDPDYSISHRAFTLTCAVPR